VHEHHADRDLRGSRDRRLPPRDARRVADFRHPELDDLTGLLQQQLDRLERLYVESLPR